MAFYENTIIAKQDLAEKEIKEIIERYEEIIKKNSGKIIKIEEWGLLNFNGRIKKYKKGFYIHYKFEGNVSTLNELKNKLNIDSSILRFLTVKYKKLDMEKEYFSKQKTN